MVRLLAVGSGGILSGYAALGKELVYERAIIYIHWQLLKCFNRINDDNNKQRLFRFMTR